MACVSDYLDESALHFPHRVAVTMGATTLTYAELAKSSAALADQLVALGVRGQPVGILLPKSPVAFVAVHAILKSGAAYVPLDPLAPALRLKWIVGSCALKVLITDLKMANALAAVDALAGLESIVLTEPGGGDDPPLILPKGVRLVIRDKIPGPSAATPVHRSLESDPAYIMYTSGSTGTPKGVVQSNGSVVAFIDWAARSFCLTPEDRLANHAPLHFDLSVLDVFGAAKAGAALVPIPEAISGIGRVLTDFIVRNRITVWYSTPSALIRCLTSPGVERLRESALRVVLFAGEVFPLKFIRQLHEIIPSVELVNLYGPTETNVCTYHRLRHEDLDDDRTHIPIGKACEYARVICVTPDGRRATPGEAGELLVSGPTVMSGYWKRADSGNTLTMEIPDPDGKLWYRTGDIVRLESSGAYTFLGRRDTIVKSRGYRVALSEVDSLLASHDAVLEVATVAVSDDAISNRLIAYVVPAGRSVSGRELHDYCSAALPQYMIPEIVLVPEIPRGSTGKVERTLLEYKR